MRSSDTKDIFKTPPKQVLGQTRNGLPPTDDENYSPSQATGYKRRQHSGRQPLATLGAPKKQRPKQTATGGKGYPTTPVLFTPGKKPTIIAVGSVRRRLFAETLSRPTTVPVAAKTPLYYREGEFPTAEEIASITKKLDFGDDSSSDADNRSEEWSAEEPSTSYDSSDNPDDPGTQLSSETSGSEALDSNAATVTDHTTIEQLLVALRTYANEKQLNGNLDQATAWLVFGAIEFALNCCAQHNDPAAQHAKVLAIKSRVLGFLINLGTSNTQFLFSDDLRARWIATAPNMGETTPQTYPHQFSDYFAELCDEFDVTFDNRSSLTNEGASPTNLYSISIREISLYVVEKQVSGAGNKADRRQARLDLDNEVRMMMLGASAHTVIPFGMLDNGPKPSILMPYYFCGDLVELIERDPTMSNAEKQSMSLNLADALTVLHARNILHRDIKCANVFVRQGLSDDRRYELVLGDLGLACMVDQAEVGKVAGSPTFIAPELLSGTDDRKNSTASDVYALGLVIYALWQGVTGPFEREALQLERQVFRGAVRFSEDDRQLCTKNPMLFNLLLMQHLLLNGIRPQMTTRVPNEAQAIVGRLWAQNPTDRPAAADIRPQFAALQF